MIAFVLTMPNVGSWNGKWTGEDNLYCKVKKLGKKKEEDLHAKSFYYNFGDGWGANINAVKVDLKTANKMRRASKGFYGYEWMIDSILTNGRVINE